MPAGRRDREGGPASQGAKRRPKTIQEACKWNDEPARLGDTGGDGEIVDGNFAEYGAGLGLAVGALEGYDNGPVRGRRERGRSLDPGSFRILYHVRASEDHIR